MFKLARYSHNLLLFLARVPQSLRREIERRLDLVSRIKYEPRLLPDGADSIGVVDAGTLCRMQAVDDIKVLGMKSFK